MTAPTMKAYMVMTDGKRDIAAVNASIQGAIGCLTACDFKEQFRIYRFWNKLRYKEKSALCAMWQVFSDMAEKDGADPAYIVVECDGSKYGICDNVYFEEMEIECDFW